MSDETELDGEQRAAVESTQRTIAVLAGPGSGKTMVLSYRARHLLREHRNTNALLLTFTNKAAAEMKARARGVSGVSTSRLSALNFHTFAAQVLRSHGDLVGIAPGFEILDAEEAREMHRTVAGATLANQPEVWSRARLTRKALGGRVAEFGREYQELKRAQGVVDFDDLVVFAAELFGTRPDIAKTYGDHYHHVLIDEFQDTNATQFELVRALVPYSASVSMFADHDQAIYGFAGADLVHIQKFITSLSAKEYFLTRNYRCKAAIVEIANRLLDADPSASDRRMTAHSAGGTVLRKGFTTTQDEAKWMVADIRERLRTGMAPENIAVLVRRSTRAKDILAELMATGVPTSDWLGDGYGTECRRVLRTCLAVARPELTPRQRKNLCDLYDLPASEAKTPAELLADNADQSGIQELTHVTELIQQGATLKDILSALQNSLESVGHSIDSVVENVTAFEEHDADFTLEHLLNELALSGRGGAPTRGGGIKVATLHRTKGLQWPEVYLAGMENDQLPDFRATSISDIAAERRLCFVGVCRAAERLVFTHASFNGGYAQSPSRFLAEMKVERM